MEALRLELGRGGDGVAGLTIDIAGLDAALHGQVPDRFRDLIRVAGYVLAADQAFGRGGDAADDLGESWRRRLRFVIPVSEPDFWRALGPQLCDTLGFLSDDDYAFTWVPATGSEPRQLSFTTPDGSPFVSWDDIEEVLLFSGGMDSFGGAVDEILGQGKRVALVTHRSAPQIWAKQRRLYEDIAARAGTNPPVHVALRAIKHTDVLRREGTQRSRSFLFAAIAGAVAQLVGRDRVRFYENGVIAVNLPISRQLYGARGTRTVHPRATLGFERILSEVAGAPFRVDNPFLFKTRTEVGELIRDRGAADLLRHTISCAKVRSRDSMHPHCGVCSQCVDRRFAMFAAGLEDLDPEEAYAVELFTGNRESEDDRRLVLEYTGAAEKYAAGDGPMAFASKFGAVFEAVSALAESDGLSHDHALQALHQLHARHGRSVLGALDQAAGLHAAALRRGALPPNSLLAMTVRSGLKRSDELWGSGVEQVSLPIAPAPAPATAPPVATTPARSKVSAEHIFRRSGAVWEIAFPGGDRTYVNHSKGCSYIGHLLRHPGQEFGVVQLEAHVAGTPVPVAVPSEGEAIDSEAAQAIGTKIRELEEEIEEALEFADQAGADRARLEMEKLRDYLSANLKPDGTPRVAPAEIEKARKRVSMAVTREFDRLQKVHGPLAAHLRRNIKLGFHVGYERPDMCWTTG